MKTPFGANLIARPEPAPTFYVDESIFSNTLVAALSAAGIAFDRVEIAVPYFTQGQATAGQCAARIIALVPKMMAIAASQPRPFLYAFGLTGGLAKVRLRIPGRT